MPTARIWSDVEVEASPQVKIVFDDIRASRGTDFVNNFWRSLANQPALLERTWGLVKSVMVTTGVLDPLVKEMIYIAVSTVNGCGYCVHSHSSAARSRGMTDDQYGELLAVIATAMETNALVSALQTPVDPEFQAS